MFSLGENSTIKKRSFLSRLPLVLFNSILVFLLECQLYDGRWMPPLNPRKQVYLQHRFP